MNTMVGWGSSWAYRSDDGVFLRKNHPVGAGQKYRLGQTVGVVYDPTRKRLWFTLDGEKAGKSSFILHHQVEFRNYHYKCKLVDAIILIFYR